MRKLPIKKIYNWAGIKYTGKKKIYNANIIPSTELKFFTKQ